MLVLVGRRSTACHGASPSCAARGVDVVEHGPSVDLILASSFNLPETGVQSISNG